MLSPFQLTYIRYPYEYIPINNKPTCTKKLHIQKIYRYNSNTYRISTNIYRISVLKSRYMLCTQK